MTKTFVSPLLNFILSDSMSNVESPGLGKLNNFLKAMGGERGTFFLVENRKIFINSVMVPFLPPPLLQILFQKVVGY